MSLFKKPKKNIRRRNIGNNDDDDARDENDAKMDVEEDDNSRIQAVISRVKERKKEKKKTLLSFEEDLLDGEDGEVFQVKKSQHSKKLMKLLDKERKKRKDTKKEEEKSNDNIATEKKIIDETSDFVLVVKNTEMPRILNGREAEAVNVGGMSSEEEEEEDNTRPQHKFAQSDHVKIVLESGQIPDAAMIHAARKRRQLAREMGAAEFIPVQTTKKPEKSRLVRDDDDDDNSEEEEERITMEVNTTAQDHERRREAFLAAQNSQNEAESDKGEEDEWESQQIRKGVTGAQLAAVQQEQYYQQQYALPPSALGVPPAIAAIASSMVVMPPVTPEMMAIPHEMSQVSQVPLLTPGDVTPQSIADRLKQRLTSLKEVHRCHLSDRDKLTSDLETTVLDRNRLEDESPVLAQKFRFYQELRGYVTDLVECLDEKMPVICALEQRMLTLLRKRTEELVERRRQDVRDQADELSPLSRFNALAQKRTKEEDEARTRRIAEREGRRTRRRRAREMKGSSIRHIEGMSSDDEMTELEITAQRHQKELIESDANMVFDDVVDDFSSLRSIMRHFEKWRYCDPDAYGEAYASLCLPKVFGPVIRLHLITWSPLQEGAEFERQKWFSTLLFYCLKDTETEEQLRQDVDIRLIPSIIEKVLLPKMADVVEAQWDPMSTSQSLRLVGFITRLIQEYPTLNSSSKHLEKLLRVIVKKMKDSVEHDVYIPIYPKQLLDGRGSSINAFFQRQFGSTVKLLRNLLSWHSIISDKMLQDIALGSLLNRYLIAALRTCDPVDSTEKCSMIMTTFPRAWFQYETPVPLLAMFIGQLTTIAKQLDTSIPAGRDAMTHVSRMLQTLRQ